MPLVPDSENGVNDTNAGDGRIVRALALVDRIRETYELDLAVGPEADGAVEELSAFVGDGDDPEVSAGEGAARHALGWLYWFRHVRSNRSDFHAANAAREHLAVCLVYGYGEEFPKPLEADLADDAEPSARTTLRAAMGQDDVGIAQQAVMLCARVAGCTPDNEPRHGIRLYYWGLALLRSFEVQADPQILNKAICVLEKAVQRRSVYDVQQAAMLLQAGRARARRFDDGRRRDTRDRDLALAHYKAVLNLAAAPAHTQVEARRAAALLLMDTDPDAAADLLEQAVRTLPLVAPRDLTHVERQDEIGAFAGLARLAAALRLDRSGVGAVGTALQLLELGRGVLLGQEFSVRSDVGRLSAAAPDLARRFTDLRNRLDQVLVEPPDDEDEAVEWQAERKRSARELDGTLREIRTLDGFGSFGLPPTAEELHTEAAHGPVVVLTTSPLRSDAIVVTAQDTIVVRLGGFDEDVLRGTVDDFRACLQSLANAPTLRQRTAHQRRLTGILGWLWDHVAAPVHDQLRALRPAGEDGALPHVRWVACGAFSLLPIHAAGRYDLPHAPMLAEHVVSSYVPSIQALRHARRQSQERNASASMSTGSLIVAVPDAPGFTRLNAVATEVDRIRALLPRPTVLTTLPGRGEEGAARRPTKANVLTWLPSSSIVHFACHGESDPRNPAESRLLLEDHVTDPLTVMSIMPVAAEHGELAYLSACSTAFNGDEALHDEAIHLASAFQLAGFPRVVGTLWEVNDTTAADVAQHFYEALTEGGEGLHPARSAYALHHAVQRIREKWPHNPDWWAAFVHVGT